VYFFFVEKQLEYQLKELKEKSIPKESSERKKDDKDDKVCFNLLFFSRE
jgi:hypothetical protein